MYPVPSQHRITFPYRARYKNGGIHKGVDFAAPTGRKVVAAVSGKVVHAGRHRLGRGWGRAYGLHVIIDCDRFADGTPGLWAGYMHLSTIAVKVGQRVDEGQVIGKVGATGNVTGPHLHFEVQKRRFWSPVGHVNPRRWLEA